MKISSQVYGVEKSLRAIGKARSAAAPAVATALEKCAEIILKKSQEYVPVSADGSRGQPPGELMRSGRVEVEGQGLGAKAHVVYDAPIAGTSESYAAAVHEIIGATHEPPPRGAKFLERATRETRGACANVLKREMEAATKVTE